MCQVLIWYDKCFCHGSVEIQYLLAVTAIAMNAYDVCAFKMSSLYITISLVVQAFFTWCNRGFNPLKLYCTQLQLSRNKTWRGRMHKCKISLSEIPPQPAIYHIIRHTVQQRELCTPKSPNIHNTRIRLRFRKTWEGKDNEFHFFLPQEQLLLTWP